MVYIKGFDKFKNKPVGRIQLEQDILKGMPYKERGKLKPLAKDLGTRRVHLHLLADEIKGKYGRIAGQRFQRAIVKFYGEPTGLTEEQKRVIIRLRRQQESSEKEGAYQTFADKLIKSREERGTGNIKGRKTGIIVKPQESAVTASQQPVAGFAGGKPAAASGFAGNRSEETSTSAVKPVEGAIGIAGLSKK